MLDVTNTSVILFFIDGLGIGSQGENNPFFGLGSVEPLAHFVEDAKPAAFGGVLTATDPRLGVEGRPQSASGQTTILTGINAPRHLGYHKQGFPNLALREIIAEHSIFRELEQRNIGPNTFANTYTPRFFSETPRWKSATTCAIEASSIQFNRLPDLLGRKALFHDFTNQSLINLGFEVPLFSPVEAAEILSRFPDRYRFTLYEHFLTDKIGHDQDFERARIHLPQLAELIRETLNRLDLEKTTFILTSDHGNIEDLSVRNHTLNDVPTITWGRKSPEIGQSITDLTHITPAILRLLTE